MFLCFCFGCQQSLMHCIEKTNHQMEFEFQRVVGKCMEK